MKSSTLLAACALVGVSSGLLAQNGLTATLKDGITTVQVKLPLEPWGVEGPITHLDTKNAVIVAQGQHCTIPLTIDGLPIGIDGTAVLDGTGERAPIGADNIHLIGDGQAHLGDAELRGGTRSLFSYAIGLQKSVAVMQRMAVNHLNYVQATLPFHLGALSAARQAAMSQEIFSLLSEVQRAQLGAAPPTSNAGTGYTGGTLKAAGHVFVDPVTGNEYLIPDLGLVVEPAENVLLGPITSFDPGNESSIPTSFVLGDILCIMNQDPRFGGGIHGFGGVPMTAHDFFSNIPADSATTAIGYTVGDNVFYAIEVMNDMVLDPNAGLVFGIERWEFDDEGNALSMEGGVSDTTGISVSIQFKMSNVGGWTPPLAMVVTPDPLMPTCSQVDFEIENFPGITVPTIEKIRIRVFKAGQGKVFQEVYDRAAVE